jgi:hypothetical protein
VKTFYLPLLKETDLVQSRALTENRYVPLDTHVALVSGTINRWMDAVDTSSATALTELFAALAPTIDGRAATEAEIAAFWVDWFSAVAQRTSAMNGLSEKLYAFYSRLASLAETRAGLLLDRATVDAPDLRRRAEAAATGARDLWRMAGRVLFDYDARYPLATGESRRALQAADAFFQSGDYVFAIDGYKRYLKLQLKNDRDAERAEPFRVADRIGQSYLKLGAFEGVALASAKAKGDQAAIARETAWETMTLDGAMQAFSWNIQRARELLQTPVVPGAAPRNRLPAAAIDSFIHQAQALIESGRLKTARGDAAGIKMLNDAITLLRTELVESRLFPSLVPGFVSSVAYRDAQFFIGSAELELARAERTKTAKEIDFPVLAEHLRRAAAAFDDITGRWRDPLNRALYERALENGKGIEAAIEEVGGGAGRFSDDVYYLTLLRAAECSCAEP